MLEQWDGSGGGQGSTLIEAMGRVRADAVLGGLWRGNQEVGYHLRCKQMGLINKKNNKSFSNKIFKKEMCLWIYHSECI